MPNTSLTYEELGAIVWSVGLTLAKVPIGHPYEKVLKKIEAKAIGKLAKRKR